MKSILQGILTLLLPPSDRTHVRCEIEELYALKVGREGRRAADAWYRRQVLGFLWRLVLTRRKGRGPSGQPRGGPRAALSVGGGFGPFTEISREIRLSARSLIRARSFLTLSVLSLTLGIGAATSIFTIANAVLLRPPPFKDPEELVGVPQGDFGTHSYPNFLTLQEESAPFLDLAAYDEWEFGERSEAPLFLREGAEATRVNVGLVSGNYFSVLGVAPILGRPLLPYDNDLQGGNAVAVLSWSFLQRRFGGDPEMVGRDINLSGATFRVVGVAPPGFTGISQQTATDVWIPTVMMRTVQAETVETDIVTHPDWHWLNLVGRLKKGVSGDLAKTRLDAVVASSSRIEGGLKEDSVSVRPIKSASISLLLRERTIRDLTRLLVTVGLVVLVVCVNVTNLFMGRMDERRGEISIRRALGAGRGALVRQFLLEALLMAGMGGAGAFLLSLWLSDLLYGVLARSMGLGISAANLDPDFRVVGFTLILVILVSLIVSGISVARHHFAGISALLRPGGRVTGGSDRLLSVQNLLVTAQIMASILLLVGSGLMVRSVLRLEDQDFGMETANTLVLTLDNERIPMDPEDGVALYDRVLERVRGIPGVEAAALAKVAPLSGVTWGGRMQFEGYEPAEGERSFTWENYVDPGFFQLMGIEFLRGRGFSPEHASGGEGVVVVSQTLVNRYWPDADPLGKTVRESGGQSFRVVGVVKDHFYSKLRGGLEPIVYFSLAQRFQKNPVILVKGPSGPLTLSPAVRAAVREVDPSLVLFHETTLEEQVQASASRERVTAFLLLAYAGTALLLAIIGTYGVASRMVVRRWKEIGIRTALGAQKEELLTLVFGSGMRVVLMGLGAGLLLSYFAGVLLQSLIFDVAPVDPLTLLTVTGILLATGALACLIPALRALQADPAKVLRGD